MIFLRNLIYNGWIGWLVIKFRMMCSILCSILFGINLMINDYCLTDFKLLLTIFFKQFIIVSTLAPILCKLTLFLFILFNSISSMLIKSILNFDLLHKIYIILFTSFKQSLFNIIRSKLQLSSILKSLWFFIYIIPYILHLICLFKLFTVTSWSS
jgi:hypothetical protein